MTKRERVIAAIHKTEVDGIPSGFSLHFPKDQEIGDKAVEAHLQFFKETDTDIIKIMNEHLLPSYGGIKTPEDYYEKIPVLGRHSDMIDKQIEMTKKIVARSDKEAFTLGTIHGICASGIHPLEKMGEGHSYDEVRQMLVDFLRLDERKMLDAMERITEGMSQLAQAYVAEAGLDAVFYAGLGAETRWFTDEEFAGWIKPFDLKIMKAIKDAGAYCFLHICKDGLNMKRYDADYAEIADVVNWGVYEAPMSLEDGKELFSGKTIMGGLKNRSGVLADGDEMAVEQEVDRVIRNYGRTGFILGADCTLATEQNLALVRAAVRAARKL